MNQLALSTTSANTSAVISTLEQAELTIRRAGIVQNESVEGKLLLEICGFSYTAKNWGSVCDRQIERHGFKDGIDYTSHTVVGRSRILNFSINAANHILLAAMTPEGKAARQEAIDLKLEQPEEAPQIQMIKAEFVVRSNAACIELAKQFGFEGNQALLSASNATKQLTGIDPITLLGVDLTSERKEKVFTPTELGRAFLDGMSGRKVNRLLEKAGLQERIEGQWELTEAGKQYAEVFDTGRSHNSGVPVKQIKWHKSVIAVLEQ